MKVGDYVRIKDGFICRIVNINDFREPSMKYGVEASYLKDIMFVGDELIIDSNPRIIKLLSPGDYVNGMHVEYVGETFVSVATGSNYLQKPIIYEDAIKSVVTQEQFERMTYKI